jgi:hypothetical protein
MIGGWWETESSALSVSLSWNRLRESPAEVPFDPRLLDQRMRGMSWIFFESLGNQQHFLRGKKTSFGERSFPSIAHIGEP